MQKEKIEKIPGDYTEMMHLKQWFQGKSTLLSQMRKRFISLSHPSTGSGWLAD